MHGGTVRIGDEPSPSFRERARILLAGDDPDARDSIVRTLSSVHDVVAVEGGSAALAVARSGSFDLILSDVAMPHGGGFDLLAVIRSDERLSSIPFIFVTERAGEGSVLECLRRGADDYLEQPFSGDELVARVDAVLRAARRHEAYYEERSSRRWFERQGDSATNEVAFRSFANQLPIPIWQQDVFGAISFTNTAWHDLLRLPRDPSSHTAEAWQRIIHVDDFGGMLGITTAAISLREAFTVAYRLKPSDGDADSYRWYDARAVPQYDDAGDFKGWIGSIIDVHDSYLREEAERTLRREMSKTLSEFRALSEALPTIVWTASPDGAGEYFNARLLEYSGLSSAEAAGNGWLALVHPDDVATATEHWQRALGNGSPYDVTYRLLGRDGVYRWFRALGLCLRDPAGQIVRWIGTCTDVDDEQRRYDRERRASDAFQDAALPKALPVVPGLRFSALYQAGNSEANVGGDWYDAYRLTDGRIVLSIGDVTGSGLSAAVMMSAVRQSIRGASQIYPDPCAVLDAADRALRAEHPAAIVSAFIGIFDRVTATLRYASAGHPPPFLRNRDGAIVELTGPDLMLGLRLDHRDHESHAITIEPDSMLVLYTDGLTEASRNTLAGEERLRGMMTDANVLASDDPARAIVADSLSQVHDDIALLVVRFDETPLDSFTNEGVRGPSRWAFDVNDDAAAADMRRTIVDALRRRRVSIEDISVTELLVSELIGNVMRHAGGTVEVAIDVHGSSAVLHVLDRGPGFHFSTRLPSSLMSESGRGLYIVAALARDFSILPRKDGGSHARVILPFDLPPPT